MAANKFQLIKIVRYYPYLEAYSGTQSRRNFGRLKATLGDFSLFCPKLRAILGDLRRFWATLGDFGRF